MKSGQGIDFNMDNLQKLMDDVAEWSDKEFGDDRILITGKLSHLMLEVPELIDSIKENQITKNVLYKYADCFMLLIDSARLFGLNAETLINITKEKLSINKKRKWGELDSEGKAMHIKEEEEKG